MTIVSPQLCDQQTPGASGGGFHRRGLEELGASMSLPAYQGISLVRGFVQLTCVPLTNLFLLLIGSAVNVYIALCQAPTCAKHARLSP